MMSRTNISEACIRVKGALDILYDVCVYLIYGVVKYSDV